MPTASFTFPRGFLWGTATAAHQVEGQNTNSWSRWEETPGRIIEGQRSGLACDWWGGRWKEDLQRAHDTGQNAHRLSVEWSRIQPAADRWDEKPLEKYAEMVRWMADHQMTSLVTLHHFSDPLWLADRGGWENEETPALFARFTRRVVDALKDYVNLWVTINEPNVYIMGGWLAGGFPPGKNDMGLAAKVMVNVLRGHAAAYRVIHELQPNAQVGVATNYRSMVPAHSWSPFDKLPLKFQDQVFNRAFNDALATGKLNLVLKKVKLPEVAGTQDFIGLNYYTRDIVAFDITQPGQMFGKRYFPAGALVSPTGFLANVPAGMWDGLRWAHKFDLPILVTENGVEDDKDTLRPRYLVEHLHQVWRAANFCWRVKGYFHWSLVDNFEWERGWTQRFGLWGLEVDTQKRIRRKSVDVYESICKANAIDSEMVKELVPEIFDQLFPAD
jgi:beta-glucosidase